jgi:hypothetical protein
MNPYAILIILISLIGTHTSVYFYGVHNGRNELIAEQKKAHDIAIVKAQEEAKNDQLQAIKVETIREESKAVFRGIRERKPDLVGDSNCPISADIVGLLNAANRGGETPATTKPNNSVPGTTPNQ